jgi:hypothetical protein
MELMRATDVLRRLAGAVVLAAITGMVVGMLALAMEASSRGSASYVVPNEFKTQQADDVVMNGAITDPRR